MNELSIVLDTESTIHLYQQIYEHIKSEIKKGKLLAGEKLPSTRLLAEHLQVSRSTVKLSYEQLEAEGYLEAKPSRGYYVCRVEELHQIQVLSKTEEKPKKQNERYLVDFSPNAVDMTHFPLDTWLKLTKNCILENPNHLFALGDSKGELIFRETIQRYLYASRGVDCNVEQIIVGAGNDYLLMLLGNILGANRVVAMENPTYPKAYRIFHSLGYQLKAIQMDQMGAMIESLEQTNADISYVMPSHQFPTGTVLPIGRRIQLLKWAAQKENRYIIEDDYDSEFRFKGKPIPALKAIDHLDKVIYMGTFSKSIAPAFRVSYMVLPKELLGVYEKEYQDLSQTVSRLDQKLLDQFIREGYFERHLNKMRKIYREKHDFLLRNLKPFEKSFQIQGDYSGLHMVLLDKKRIPEDILIKQAKEAGIKVYGMSNYLMFQEGDRYHNKLQQRETKSEFFERSGILLGFADLSLKSIEEGLNRLKTAWEI